MSPHVSPPGHNDFSLANEEIMDRNAILMPNDYTIMTFASNIEAMTSAYRFFIRNWFILKDKLDYAMVIGFICKSGLA